jgi:hypothetical protein
MSKDLRKHITYRVLIIEDEPGWFENMEYFLNALAKDCNVLVKSTIADNAEKARQLMASELFHAIAIDLRLPEKSGGILTSHPYGIELAIHQVKALPLVWAHIFTAYAEEHALSLYRQITGLERSILPIWEKSEVDNAGENRYTQKEWAQQVLMAILPEEEAKLIKFRNSQQKFSHFGEALDFSIRVGCRHLPPGLAQGCGTIRDWLNDGLSQRLEFKAFNEILFFAENLQHWLWVQAAALLNAFGLVEKIVWPSEGNAKAMRFVMEQALADMLKSLNEQITGFPVKTWLEHLHQRGNGKEPYIIEALGQIRVLRNEIYHQRPGEELSWKRLVFPFRIIMDAAAFLAAYPVLTNPVPAPDGRWRFKVLQGSASPFPEIEWDLADGELGSAGRFLPKESGIIYQLWPCEHGGYRLLKLSPFVQRRPGMGLDPGLWLLSAPSQDPAEKKISKLWERNELDGSEKCNSGVASERLTEIAKLWQCRFGQQM